MPLTARAVPEPAQTQRRSSAAEPPADWVLDNHAALAEALRERDSMPLQFSGKGEKMPRLGDKDDVKEEVNKKTQASSQTAEVVEEGDELPEELEAELEGVTFETSVKTRSGNVSKQSLWDFLQAYVKGEPDEKLRAHATSALDELIKKNAKNLDLVAALQWARDLVAFPPLASGGGGSSTLKVGASSKGVEVSGRPAFEGKAIKLEGIRKRYARRHVIPWHTLRRATANVIDAIVKADPKDEKIQSLATRLAALVPPEKPASSTSTTTTTSSSSAASSSSASSSSALKPMAQLEAAVTKLLRYMNSNTRNLWAGPGYENSLINTYQGAMRGWATTLAGMKDEDITAWRKQRAAEMTKNAKGKQGAYVNTLASLKYFIDPSNEMKNEDFIEMLPDLADNFEVDIPFGDDRKRATNIDATARADLLEIGGKFLGLADADLGWHDAETLETYLTELIQQFLGTATQSAAK